MHISIPVSDEPPHPLSIDALTIGTPNHFNC